MKQKLFDIKLFKEGIKQTRLTALIFLFSSILVSLLTPITSFINSNRFAKSINAQPNQINIELLAIGAMILMYIAPFIFILNQFSYLNKRSGSDIYHSIPFTRGCLSISFLSSIITWQTIIVVSNVLITTLGCIIIGDIVNLTFIPYLIVSLTSGYLLFTATAFIAVNLTGTLFSSIVLMGLVTLLPRFILSIFRAIADSTLMIATISDNAFFLDERLNIPLGYILSGFNSIGDKNVLTSLSSIAYTLILAIILLVLGVILSSKRSSQTAGKSAPNTLMQGIYRTAITTPWVVVLAGMYASTENIEKISIVVVVIGTLITYFTYELVTTKKFLNVLKSIPYLLVLVVIGIVFYGSIIISKNVILNDIPTMENLSSISFRTLSQYNYDKTKKSYNEILIEDVKYQDLQILDIALIALKTSANDVKENRFNNPQNELDRMYFENISIAQKNGRVLNRKIKLTANQYEAMQAIKLKNAEYKNAIKATPNEKEVKHYFFYNGDEQFAKELYNSFIEEFALLTPEQITKEGILIDNKYNYYAYTDNYIVERDNAEVLTVSGNKGLTNFTNSYKITKATPKTFKLVVQKQNESNTKEVMAIITNESKLNSLNLNFEISANAVDNTKNNVKFSTNFNNEIYNSIKSDNYTKIIDMLKIATARDIDFTKPISKVNIYLYPTNKIANTEMIEKNIYETYLQFTSEELDLLKIINGNINRY